MSEKFLNAIKRQAAMMDTNKAHAQWGIVTAYDPATATAKVNLQPENQPTDWLPINYGTVGQGIGLIHPPVQGQQVCVVFDGGSHDDGVIMGGTYSDANPVPNGANGNPVQSGEFCAVFGNGQSFIHMTADGSIILKAGSNSITLSSSGIAIVGNVSQTMGGITTTGDVVASSKSLVHHVHGGVQSGSSDTGQPI